MLDDFLSTLSCAVPRVDVSNLKSIQKSRCEDDRIVDMWEAFSQVFNPFFGNLRVCKTTGSFDKRWRVYRQKVKPAIAIYEVDVPFDIDINISRIETWIEVTADEKDDPFEDPPEELSGEDLCDHLDAHPFERDSDPGMLSRGRALAHTVAQLGSQYRNFTFSTLISGKYARLARWDRAGAVVSRRFDWTTAPELLADFFWRFLKASREERG